MISTNVVVLAGHLTRMPELRHTPSGVAVCDLRIAVNDTYRSRSGEKIESALFAGVSVWDRQAESCAQYLSKGAPVLVEGRLKLDQWKTEDGQHRSRIYVRAHRVQFLPRTQSVMNREASVSESADSFAVQSA